MLGFYICIDMVDSWFFPVALFKRHQKVKNKKIKKKTLVLKAFYAFTTVVCNVNFNFVTASAFWDQFTWLSRYLNQSFDVYLSGCWLKVTLRVIAKICMDNNYKSKHPKRKFPLCLLYQSPTSFFAREPCEMLPGFSFKMFRFYMHHARE